MVIFFFFKADCHKIGNNSCSLVQTEGLSFLSKLAGGCGLASFGLHSSSSPLPYIRKPARWAELLNPVQPLSLSLSLSLWYDGAVEELSHVFPPRSFLAGKLYEGFPGSSRGNHEETERKVFLPSGSEVPALDFKSGCREALGVFACTCVLCVRTLLLVSNRSRLGRAGPSRTAPRRLAGREPFLRNGWGAECRRPAPAGCLGRLSGWASGCRGRPWRREPQDRTQTCRRTSHLPPEKRVKRHIWVTHETSSLETCITYVLYKCVTSFTGSSSVIILTDPHILWV